MDGTLEGLVGVSVGLTFLPSFDSFLFRIEHLTLNKAILAFVAEYVTYSPVWAIAVVGEAIQHDVVGVVGG
jgi:hypothetical protein